MKKYRKIKFRILDGLKLHPLLTVNVLQDHEDRIKALEDAADISSNQVANRDISFTVSDGTDPINGATVSIGDITGTTDSAGGCTLSNVADGTHDVTVTATGYTMRIEEINVSEIETSFEIILVSE